MKTSFLSLRLLCVLTVCLILAQPLRAQDKDKWLPLDPQDLAATKPQVEPDADAEVLLWEVRVEDTEDGVKSDNYIRLKIFTERGRELNSKIFLSYGQVGRFSTKIEGLTARTITPDGNIIEVKSSDIFESDQIRRGQAKI